MQISIAEIAGKFPDYRVAFVVAEGLTIAPERPPALDALIAEREAAARATWGGMELSQIPGIAAWRAAYKGFGIKQTRYRSSVERLVKNVLAGRGLPAINDFVDAYNAVSIVHVMPLGADDLDLVMPSPPIEAVLDDARCSSERLAIRTCLDRTGQNVSRAARDLGVSRTTMYRLLAKHGMRP